MVRRFAYLPSDFNVFHVNLDFHWFSRRVSILDLEFESGDTDWTDGIFVLQVYYKIFCAARKIVLEERRAQSHLEAHCYLDIEPTVQHHQPSVVNRQLNSDVQGVHGSPPVIQHRSSSTSTTVSEYRINLSFNYEVSSLAERQLKYLLNKILT